MGVRVLAAAAVLALAPTMPRAAPGGEEGAPHTASAPAPALRSQVFQRSRSTFEVHGDGDPAAWGGPSHRAASDAGPPPVASLHQLARGTLLRAQLNEDAALTLRLRGGRLGLFLSVRLDGR